jgi:hypothetical protein
MMAFMPMTMWNRKWQWNSQYPKKKEENKLVEMKKHNPVLSTIVQMLDVITSFNCNCYSPNDVLKK